MDNSGEPVVSVEDLSVSFPRAEGGRDHAVLGVWLDLWAGRTTAVVGESGSGKSVTALSVLRLVPSPPARYGSGRVVLRGWGDGPVDLLGVDEQTLRRIRGDEIAMIFQEPMTSLNPVMTIGAQIIEAVRLHREVSASAARAIALSALKDVGIDRGPAGLSAYPHEFSGGMRQRVMIAIALACEPRVLIADEPTTALDVTIQAQILNLIGRLKEERGLAVMFITHDLGLVAEHADDVVVMYAGRVVEKGPIDRVLGSPAHPYTRGLLAVAPSIDSISSRLRTIDAVLEDESAFDLDLPGGARRAWWPGRGHRGPSSGRSELVEAGPGRSVRVWAEGA